MLVADAVQNIAHPGHPRLFRIDKNQVVIFMKMIYNFLWEKKITLLPFWSMHVVVHE